MVQIGGDCDVDIGKNHIKSYINVIQLCDSKFFHADNEASASLELF